MGPGNLIWNILAGVVGVLVGGFAVVLVERLLARSRLERANLSIEQMLEEAQTKVREIQLQAEKEALRARNDAEADVQKRLQELRREDERL